MELLSKKHFELIVVGDDKFSTKKNRGVKYLGHINNMAELYVSVDFTVLPSKYEPFGLIVPESLQCGTPVIVSNKVGACELINDNEGIIIKEITPAGIAKAIETAQKQKFDIRPNFAETNGLTIQQHIEKIIETSNGS